MPTTLPPRANGAAGMTSRLRGWLFAVYCLSLAVVCGLLVVEGPRIHAASQAREAQIVEGEDKAFCNSFGAGPETARYAQCAGELAQIRARHLQRYLSHSIL